MKRNHQLSSVLSLVSQKIINLLGRNDNLKNMWPKYLQVDIHPCAKHMTQSIILYLSCPWIYFKTFHTKSNPVIWAITFFNGFQYITEISSLLATVFFCSVLVTISCQLFQSLTQLFNIITFKVLKSTNTWPLCKIFIYQNIPMHLPLLCKISLKGSYYFVKCSFNNMW